jgi:hypothetical protein
MNLSNIDIVKISDSNYRIYQLINSKRSSLEFELDGIKTPFGLEKFHHVYYINWEIDNSTLETFKQLELEFKDIIVTSNPKYNSWSWNTNLKEKQSFQPLLKTRVPQIKGKFTVETTKSLFEINKTDTFKIIVCLESIWFMEKNKTFGLLWTLKTIK